MPPCARCTKRFACRLRLVSLLSLLTRSAAPPSLMHPQVRSMDEKKGGGDEAFKAGQHALAVELYGECLQLLRDAVRDTAAATAGAVTTRVMVLCS